MGWMERRPNPKETIDVGGRGEASRAVGNDHRAQVIHWEGSGVSQATGGGIVERPANRNILKKMGFVVWLVVSPEEILRRTAKNRERPLLNTDDPEETIRRLLERRVNFYRDTAHQEIETDDLTFPEITTGIVESARYFFSG